MKMRFNKDVFFCFARGALVAVVLSACTPTTATRGNYIDAHRLSQIKPGEHSKSEVMRILGSPTTVAPFDENTWYYLGQHTEKHGIFDPEVKEERIIKVTFNNSGTVQSVIENDEGRMDIPISDRETPTHGNEITVMQQLLGNVGKFNPQKEER
jgi:outer membrane protein assembly factor BamE (lipoprotein component of BamABCDE complex)